MSKQDRKAQKDKKIEIFYIQRYVHKKFQKYNKQFHHAISQHNFFNNTEHVLIILISFIICNRRFSSHIFSSFYLLQISKFMFPFLRAFSSPSTFIIFFLVRGICMLYLVCILISARLTVSFPNLLCDSGFQSTILAPSDIDSRGISFNWNNLDNNLSCWYSKMSNFIQIKEQSGPPSSKTSVADTVSGSKYDICQRVSMRINSTYRLNFSVITDFSIISTKIVLYFDGIIEIVKSYNSSAKIYQQTYVSIGSKNIGEICFQPEEIVYGSNFFLPIVSLKYGPMLDNITLEEIYHYTPDNYTNSTIIVQNESNSISIKNISTNISNLTQTTIYENRTKDFANNSNNSNSMDSNGLDNESIRQTQTVKFIIYVNINVEPDIKNNIIVLKTNLSITDNHILNLEIFKNSKVTIEDDEQLQLVYEVNSDGNMVMKLIPNKMYDYESLLTIKVYFPQVPSIFAQYQFKITLNGAELKVTSLRKKDFILKEISPVVSVIMKKIKQSFIYTNLFGCSYFLINIISFCNLTLFYYFLFLKSLPTFTRNLIFTLAYIIYSRGSLLDIFYKIDDIKESLDFDFTQIGIMQKMPSVVDNGYWFKYFDIYSNFFQSNMQSLVLLGIMIGKLLLLCFLSKLLPKRIENIIKFNFMTLFIYFVEQVECFVPFFIVSAFTCFLKIGQLRLIGKFNTILHIILVVTILMLPFISYIAKFGCKKKANKRENYEKYFYLFDQFTSYAFSIIIPSLTILRNKDAYFLILTIILLVRFYFLMKFIEFQGKIDKAKIILTQIAWIIYHFSFTSLALVQKLSDEGPLRQACFYIGYIIVFSLLSGICFDILYSIANIFRKLCMLITFFKKNRILPEQMPDGFKRSDKRRDLLLLSESPKGQNQKHEDKDKDRDKNKAMENVCEYNIKKFDHINERDKDLPLIMTKVSQQIYKKEKNIKKPFKTFCKGKNSVENSQTNKTLANGWKEENQKQIQEVKKAAHKKPKQIMIKKAIS